MPLRYAQRCEAWICYLEQSENENAGPKMPKPSRGPKRLAFEGVGFFDVGLLCLFGSLGIRKLAKHFVNANDPDAEGFLDVHWCEREIRRRLVAATS